MRTEVLFIMELFKLLLISTSDEPYQLFLLSVIILLLLNVFIKQTVDAYEVYVRFVSVPGNSLSFYISCVKIRRV